MTELTLAIGISIGGIVGLLVGVAVSWTYHTRRLERALREILDAIR